MTHTDLHHATHEAGGDDEITISGATPDLAAVLAEGNDAGGADIENVGFLSLGAAPAASGAVRLTLDEYVTGHDGSSDIRLIGANNSGRVIIAPDDNARFGGHIEISSDNLQDIGAVGARWRNAFLMGLRMGATPATLGTIRLPNNFQVYARNGINSLDIPVLSLIGDEVLIGGLAISNGYIDADLSPLSDNGGSLGADGQRWQNIFAGLPGSDPNVVGQLYTMDAAGLSAELAAGSRYVLISNGP